MGDFVNEHLMVIDMLIKASICPSEWLIAEMKTFAKKDVWRVEIEDDNSVEVLRIDLEQGDKQSMKAYASVDELPDWVSGRLSVLRMIREPFPTDHVSGVGRRISQNIFWLDEEN